MQVNRIQSFITPKTTGYAAAASLVVAVASGAIKNKNIKKVHKPFAWITAALTILHIGLIEYYSHKSRINKRGK